MSPQSMQAPTRHHTFVVGRAADRINLTLKQDVAQKGPETS